MAKKTTPPTEDAPIRVHIRPIDITAKGSAAEVRAWRELRVTLLRTLQDSSDEPTSLAKQIAYYSAVDERDAFIKARSYTEDGADLEAAWAQISQVELNDYFTRLLAGGVPKASGGS